MNKEEKVLKFKPLRKGVAINRAKEEHTKKRTASSNGLRQSKSDLWEEQVGSQPGYNIGRQVPDDTQIKAKPCKIQGESSDFILNMNGGEKNWRL